MEGGGWREEGGGRREEGEGWRVEGGGREDKEPVLVSNLPHALPVNS